MSVPAHSIILTKVRIFCGKDAVNLPETPAFAGVTSFVL